MSQPAWTTSVTSSALSTMGKGMARDQKGSVYPMFVELHCLKRNRLSTLWRGDPNHERTLVHSLIAVSISAYLYFVLNDQIPIFGNLKISGHLGVGCSKYATIYKKGWGHMTSQTTSIKVCHVDHTKPTRQSQDFTNTFLSLLLMSYSSTKILC